MTLTLESIAARAKRIGAEKPTGKALVIFAHGEGWVAMWHGDWTIEEMVSGQGGSKDGFDLEGFDYAPPAGDGVYIAELCLVDDGPGDWPGTREALVQLKNLRPATKAEWQSYRKGEWPWDDYEKYLPIEESS